MVKSKSWLAFLIMLLTGLVYEFIGFWYGILISGLLGGLLLNKALKGFFIGLLGGICCWAIILFYKLIFWNSSVALLKITAQIMYLPSSLSFLIIIVTTIIGGILCGLGSLNGVLWKNLFLKK